jgi:hypothetical protein
MALTTIRAEMVHSIAGLLNQPMLASCEENPPVATAAME